MAEFKDVSGWTMRHDMPSPYKNVLIFTNKSIRGKGERYMDGRENLQYVTAAKHNVNDNSNTAHINAYG